MIYYLEDNTLEATLCSFTISEVKFKLSLRRSVISSNSWIFTKRAKSQLKSRLNYSSSLEMLLFDEKRRRREIEKVFIIRAAQSSIQSKNNKKIFRLKRLVMRRSGSSADAITEENRFKLAAKNL